MAGMRRIRASPTSHFYCSKWIQATRRDLHGPRRDPLVVQALPELLKVTGQRGAIFDRQGTRAGRIEATFVESFLILNAAGECVDDFARRAVLVELIGHKIIPGSGAEVFERLSRRGKD